MKYIISDFKMLSGQKKASKFCKYKLNKNNSKYKGWDKIRYIHISLQFILFFPVAF